VTATSHPVETINAVTLFTADMGAAVDFYGALGFELLSGTRPRVHHVPRR